MTPHICTTSSCVSIGWLQTNSNEQALPSPPPAHTHPQRYGALHTHRCVSKCSNADWTEGNTPETRTIEVHPSLCTDIPAAGMLHKGPSSPHGGQRGGVAALQRAQPGQKFLTPCTPALLQTPAELCLISSTTERQFCPFSFI